MSVFGEFEVLLRGSLKEIWVDSGEGRYYLPVPNPVVIIIDLHLRKISLKLNMVNLLEIQMKQ